MKPFPLVEISLILAGVCALAAPMQVPLGTAGSGHSCECTLPVRTYFLNGDQFNPNLRSPKVATRIVYRPSEADRHHSRDEPAFRDTVYDGQQGLFGNFSGRNLPK